MHYPHEHIYAAKQIASPLKTKSTGNLDLHHQDQEDRSLQDYSGNRSCRYQSEKLGPRPQVTYHCMNARWLPMPLQEGFWIPV